MPAFAAFLLAVDVANLWGPAPPQIKVIAITGEAALFLVAGIAQVLDKLREPNPDDPPIRLHLNAN